jgi:hypothetical protein
MEKAQFEEIRNFTRSLTEKRLQMADGQLLDLCQEHLDALVEHLADNFEEHPHINDEAVAPEPPPIVDASRADSELEPPPPAHSEPHREVRHTVAHKRPTPRKTHR